VALPLAGDAEDLAEVAGADEEEVHAVHRGDFVALLERPERFDLDGDEVVPVGVRGELREGLAAEHRVEPAAVEAAVAAGSELRPLHELFGMSRRLDAGGHQSAGPGFEESRRHAVVRHRHPDEAIHPIRPAAGGSEGDLLVGHAAVLLVEPDAVEPAAHAVNIEHDGMNDPPRAENATELAGSEESFEGHG